MLTYPIMQLLGEPIILVDHMYVEMSTLIRILKSKIYRTRFRLFVLNPDETVDYEIPQDDIILDSGNYSENYQQGQRRNVNLALINIDGKYTPSINTIWVHHKFRFDIGFEQGNDVYWFPRGIYVLGNPNVKHEDSDKVVNLTLVDKFAIFEGTSGTLDYTYEIPAGTDIRLAIESILALDNGSGYPYDNKKIVYDSTFEGRVTPYTLTKDAGSKLSELLLDLAIMLNAECFYNSVGHLCFININETTLDANKSVLWDYIDDKPEYLTSSANFDFENVINVVQVVGDNINNELFSATAINNNPESPICTQRIGHRVNYINDSNINSDIQAQDRADYELRKEGILKTTFSINVTFNPLLLVNNLITLNDSYYGVDKNKFLIQSISYNTSDNNTMTLTCSNLTNYANQNTHPIFNETDIISLPTLVSVYKQSDDNTTLVRFYFYRANTDNSDWILYNTVDITGNNNYIWSNDINQPFPWYMGANKIKASLYPSGDTVISLQLEVRDKSENDVHGGIIDEIKTEPNALTMGVENPIIEVDEFNIISDINQMNIRVWVTDGGIACVDEDTLIAVSKQENVAIKNLNIGDKVLDKNYNETAIIDIVSHPEYNITIFTLENDDEIVANNQHKFLMGDTFVNTNSIKYFTTANGKTINIKNKEYRTETREVYEIITESNTYQLYNGIVCECENIDKEV